VSAKAKTAKRDGQVVDTESGSILEGDAAKIRELEIEVEVGAAKLKGAERDINAWRVRYEDLRRDKEAEAREHELWDPAMDLFALWKLAATGHSVEDGPPWRKSGKARKKSSKFSADRFFMVLPLLKRYGEAMCQRAVIGRCWDHYSDQRANGSTIHYCEWERIFGSKGQGATVSSNFEESANKAPPDWEERVEKLKKVMADG
jgi:hypothetical protein